VPAKRSEIIGRLPQMQGFTSIRVRLRLTSHIYSLSRKLNPDDVLMTAKQFFTVPEIEVTIALLDVAAAQIDALADKNIGNQIRPAAGCI